MFIPFIIILTSIYFILNLFFTVYFKIILNKKSFIIITRGKTYDI